MNRTQLLPSHTHTHTPDKIYTSIYRQGGMCSASHMNRQVREKKRNAGFIKEGTRKEPFHCPWISRLSFAKWGRGGGDPFLPARKASLKLPTTMTNEACAGTCLGSHLWRHTVCTCFLGDLQAGEFQAKRVCDLRFSCTDDCLEGKSTLIVGSPVAFTASPALTFPYLPSRAICYLLEAKYNCSISLFSGGFHS